MKALNNKTEKLGDDLKQSIKKGSKLYVAAAIFSIYGYEALKKELSCIDDLKFIFTDPTFIEQDKKRKEEKKFEIHTGKSVQALSGSEFEINLKNELKGSAIAKECKKWIEKKVQFKTNLSSRHVDDQIIIENGNNVSYYKGANEFSSAGFGYEKDNAITRNILKIDEYEFSKAFLDEYKEIWDDETALKDITEEVSQYISNLYKENSPEFIYQLILFNIFSEFLEDISEDNLPNEKTGFKNSVIWSKLYDFQRDAVIGIINKLEKFNGCILADSVGLGKTFTALGVIKYYQERNKSILVLCPKKLSDNWNTYTANYIDNILAKDRFNYDVFYHTDLRDGGKSDGRELSRINRGNYDLVVIDESHNFRNNDPRRDRVTRYQRLMNQVIKAGVETKVLMLSATPVNNRFTDLRNQIALAYEGHTDIVDEEMGTEKSIDMILRQAQTVFNERSKAPLEERTGSELLKRLSSNFDFFKLLDNITIARSRKHIEKFYNMDEIGKFPKRLTPKAYNPEITTLPDFMPIKELYDRLGTLSMCIYTPFNYILASKKAFYEEKYDTIVKDTVTLTQENREESLKILMRVNFLKRLESSVDSFRITLGKFIKGIEGTLKSIEKFNSGEGGSSYTGILANSSYGEDDSDDWLDDENSIGDKVKINLDDMNLVGWERDLKRDLEIAQNILDEMKKITPKYDKKLLTLQEIIEEKINNPINPGNKKILIFSAFADTAQYLYEQLSASNKFLGLETAVLTGGNQTNKCSIDGVDKQFNSLLTHFSPISKGRTKESMKGKEIDVLIATDCISEGQNLQDCDYLINYDIHWNPVRIIQRFGRVDRIGSKNEVIQLVNFWPQISLDDYINLKNRVENKMSIVDITATGADNVLTNKESDLMFRKIQLEKLKDQVVDLEDMDTGISITDLGLNDFRMDLINYVREHGSLKGVAYGMHTVCKAEPELGINKGVIYVLKNINNAVNINNSNQLHPFYLVYIGEDGSIQSTHLEVKRTLDVLRAIAKGKDEPISEVYEIFNEETNDGKDMSQYSSLLNQAISSILNVSEESDLDSLLTPGGTTLGMNTFKGLEDFELIAFIVIK